MIRRLRGEVVEKLRNQLVVDVAGVGYDVYVTPPVLTSAPIDGEITLYISESIREDGHDLYGFTSPEDRAVFEQLRKVSGVGPKASLSVCAFYSASELSAIFASGDDTKLALVPGIGKKTASKIVLEMKDKVVAGGADKTDGDVVDALQSLGYSPGEIAKLVAKIPSNLLTVSEKVTWVLRNIGN